MVGEGTSCKNTFGGHSESEEVAPSATPLDSEVSVTYLEEKQIFNSLRILEKLFSEWKVNHWAVQSFLALYLLRIHSGISQGGFPHIHDVDIRVSGGMQELDRLFILLESMAGQLGDSSWQISSVNRVDYVLLGKCETATPYITFNIGGVQFDLSADMTFIRTDEMIPRIYKFPEVTGDESLVVWVETDWGCIPVVAPELLVMYYALLDRDEEAGHGMSDEQKVARLLKIVNPDQITHFVQRVCPEADYLFKVVPNDVLFVNFAVLFFSKLIRNEVYDYQGLKVEHIIKALSYGEIRGGFVSLSRFSEKLSELGYDFEWPEEEAILTVSLLEAATQKKWGSFLQRCTTASYFSSEVES